MGNKTGQFCKTPHGAVSKESHLSAIFGVDHVGVPAPGRGSTRQEPPVSRPPFRRPTEPPFRRPQASLDNVYQGDGGGEPYQKIILSGGFGVVWCGVSIGERCSLRYCCSHARSARARARVFSMCTKKPFFQTSGFSAFFSIFPFFKKKCISFHLK